MKPISNALLIAFVIPGLLAQRFPLGSFKNENKVSQVYKSFLDTSTDLCSHNPSENLYSGFNAIVFGDFVTAGHQSIYGPLAVKGMFYAFDFAVNSAHTSDCANLEGSLDDYGLVVTGSVVGSRINTNGAVYLPSGSDTSAIIKKPGNACPVYNNKQTGQFDFDQIENLAIDTSKQFAAEAPTLYLDSDNKLHRIADPLSSGYDVITFNTCNKQNCPLFPQQMSDASKILLGKTGWDGPAEGGESWPSKLIVNIPVDVRGSIQLQGPKVTSGMVPCSTFFNFYPSDKTGAYTDGRFDVFRYTTDQFTGTVLAPKGEIADGSTGSFAGQIIASKYTSFSANTNIYDFAAIGSNCSDEDSNCLPFHGNPDDTTVTATTTTSTSVEDEVTTTITSLGEEATSVPSIESTTEIPTLSVYSSLPDTSETDTNSLELPSITTPVTIITSIPVPTLTPTSILLSTPISTPTTLPTCPNANQSKNHEHNVHRHHHHLKETCCEFGGDHHHHELLFCEYDDHQHEEVQDNGELLLDHTYQYAQDEYNQDSNMYLEEDTIEEDTIEEDTTEEEEQYAEYYDY